MDEDGKFWFSLCGLLALVLIALIVSMAIYGDRTNAKILKAIDAGADPIAASCALDPTNIMCQRVVQEKK